ncbi:MAG TPA: hypothetical protein GXZ87_03550 [Bacteroidales bacterium]|nr:hypothetical protein [Bacteroidales bacterium]
MDKKKKLQIRNSIANNSVTEEFSVTTSYAKNIPNSNTKILWTNKK